MSHHPEIVSWNLTNRCNLRCAHCYMDAGATKKGELSTEECYRVIDQIAALETGMVILSGGEPLLRPDIFDLASYASENGLLVVMGSNGTLIDQKVASRLALSKVKGIGISLDSLEPEKHDSFRGVKGCWEMAVAGMRACLGQGLPVIVQTTLTPWNYEEIPALIEFTQKKGGTAFNLYYLVCTGRGEKLTDISPQQYEESLVLMSEAQACHSSIMVRAKCAPQVYRISQERGLPPAGGGCPAGVSYLRIGPEGEVTPCPYLPLVAGNVRDMPLKDIWESATIFVQLRNRNLRGRCGICEYHETCGGCRARAFAVSEDYLGEDPWCLYQPGPASPIPSSRVAWSPDAEERLQLVPAFIRSWVKTAIESYASERGHSVVTAALMAEVRSSFAGGVHRPIEPHQQIIP